MGVCVMYRVVELPNKKQQETLDNLHSLVKDFETSINANNCVPIDVKMGRFVFLKAEKSRRVKLGVDTPIDGYKLFFELPWQERLNMADEIIALCGD